MYSTTDCRCIVCHLIFCCGECRWKHEQNTHGLAFNCPICRGYKYLCEPQDLTQPLLEHLAEEHFPLHCSKCGQIFNKMEDLTNIDKCNSISELVKENVQSQEVDDKFDSIYDKINDNYEEISKNTKTAVVTPIVRKKNIVDYDLSDDEFNESKSEVMKTPHPSNAGKTPKINRKRDGTPHVKKLLQLMKQKAFEEYEETIDESDETPDTTPSKNENFIVPEPPKDMTTPTSHIPNLLKLAQAVTTSTPTHPLIGGWSMFPEPGADSPLSEIENSESPAQSNTEASKTESETIPTKLKSIIVVGSKLRLGSQDSSEKHVTFQDSNADGSIKKKVKFADDTVFQQEPKIIRVYRKPKRMLTPGPQRPRFCYNPRFQALINRFENQGMIMARTPVNKKEQPQETTPPVGEPSNLPARAINFKEESPIVDVSKESNELYKTCEASPNVSNAITALTANIAGSLQTCLHSALKATEEDTEIQFKFVITKRKIRRYTEEEEINRMNEEMRHQHNNNKDFDTNKENLWSTVAKAVKNAFWGDSSSSYATATPYRSLDSTSSSASKRKCDELSDSDISPINHKRHKYNGRIKGRPPLRRTFGVTGLRPSRSAEQESLMKNMQDDGMNLSF